MWLSSTVGNIAEMLCTAWSVIVVLSRVSTSEMSARTWLSLRMKPDLWLIGEPPLNSSNCRRCTGKGEAAGWDVVPTPPEIETEDQCWMARNIIWSFSRTIMNSSRSWCLEIQNWTTSRFPYIGNILKSNRCISRSRYTINFFFLYVSLVFQMSQLVYVPNSNSHYIFRISVVRLFVTCVKFGFNNSCVMCDCDVH